MLQKNYNVYMPIILGKVNEKHNIARIWVYEMTLTFASRFLNDDDINWLIILLDKGEKKILTLMKIKYVHLVNELLIVIL